MKWKFQTAGRLLALLALSGALLAAPLPAQAAPGVLTGLTGTGSKLELELTEMELEITDDDPRPKGYLYTSGQSDYYFIVWMSSNSNVATVDGDGKVTGRNAGTAIITAISDHGERAACKVTVTRKNEESARKKPTLDTTSLSLVLQYNDLHPTHQLQLTNSDHSFLYVYQWMSSNPEVATVSDKGLVTAQAAGTTTITAMVSNGQALRCSVTVTSDIGKVTLNKSDLLLRIVGTQERLTATVAVEGGGSVPITWVSSNPGVVTVDADGVVTAIADGEAKVTALSPAGRFDVCSVVVGMAAEKYESEADLADELKLPDPYVAVRLNNQKKRKSPRPWLFLTAMGGFCVYGNGCAGKNLPKRNFFQKIFCVAWRGVPDTSGRLRQVKKDKMARTLFKTGSGCPTERRNRCKKGGCPACLTHFTRI